MGFRLTKPCDKCNGTGEITLWYQSSAEIETQTPRQVWDEYKANGYTWREALREEMSYWN